MKAMILERVAKLSDNPAPLVPAEWSKPVPQSGELLIKVIACGVCHTELDEIEGRMPPAKLPVILGHQVVGRVDELGDSVSGFSVGDRVGVAWIHSACGVCGHCRSGNENLCERFEATGRDAHGGYAEFMTAPAGFVFSIPEPFSDLEAAPLLCAGAIGYRSLKLTRLENGENLGLTGFGASAHLVLMMVRHRFPGSRVFVFARNPEERAFALELGAIWAGDTDDEPPAKLDAIIDTTPAWEPVVASLRHLAPGGRLVINAIRKEASDKDYLLRLDYPSHLWMEKEIKSVANVARSDVGDFLALAAEIPIRPEIEEYALEDANCALLDLKMHRIRGAKVLRVA
ncbi:alcohol dehydrogenase [Methylocaldum marinum]|uniref:Alcohol dehydrogenase n=1 Tax=Methylocaldum marinum TaxID=1432792 RepID=A0A250KM63_9GAMM|nr:zinc-dependent alcohol dehydrogenase family protein [Methylocaldum marinum]BBA32654.1 alcohol dehydrogenase [Methylocaldum marinum]